MVIVSRVRSFLRNYCLIDEFDYIGLIGRILGFKRTIGKGLMDVTGVDSFAVS